MSLSSKLTRSTVVPSIKEPRFLTTHLTSTSGMYIFVMFDWRNGLFVAADVLVSREFGLKTNRSERAKFR